MGRSLGRTAALAVGAVLAAPALGLLAGAAAHAAPGDDLAHLGPIAIDGYTDALTYNTSTYAFDNFLTGSYNLIPFQFDLSYGTPGSDDFGLLLTIPGIYQGGLQDIGGDLTPISTFDATQFLQADLGLIELGGTPPASQLVESFGPLTIDGYTDLFSLNTDTLAFDNFLEGATNGLPFSVDFFSGAPGPDSSEFLLTIPSLLQVGLSDAAGVLTPIFSIDYADFVNADIGLTAIGGIAGL
ncbi:hypothetical protein [Mycobacterium sp.]|uniref:hypothetical protein n=1 Tax=Mycobacterium sp. TaxID=1785 RepID=UPI0025EE5B2C|nr:hypothetical protein [Mycobacterium sp.]